MNGDIPCGLTCHNRSCPWNDRFGACADNGVCDRRVLEPEEKPDYLRDWE